jgi:hypothetical protein
MKTPHLRRIIAQTNQARRAGLSPHQQLQILDTRRGESKRERARLLAQISAGQSAQPTTKSVSKKERKAMRRQTLS